MIADDRDVGVVGHVERIEQRRIRGEPGAQRRRARRHRTARSASVPWDDVPCPPSAAVVVPTARAVVAVVVVVPARARQQQPGDGERRPPPRCGHGNPPLRYGPARARSMAGCGFTPCVRVSRVKKRTASPTADSRGRPSRHDAIPGETAGRRRGRRPDRARRARLVRPGAPRRRGDGHARASGRRPSSSPRSARRWGSTSRCPEQVGELRVRNAVQGDLGEDFFTRRPVTEIVIDALAAHDRPGDLVDAAGDAAGDPARRAGGHPPRLGARPGAGDDVDRRHLHPVAGRRARPAHRVRRPARAVPDHRHRLVLRSARLPPPPRPAERGAGAGLDRLPRPPAAGQPRRGARRDVHPRRHGLRRCAAG